MVRQKSYTENEQVAILNAILVNKDLLEDLNAKKFSRTDAWREKWDEIATTIDAYFGTSRGTKQMRTLYQKWKSAAKRKYKLTQITALTAQDFEARLTMPEKILRQIRPDIFPKIISEATTSTKRGADEASCSEKEEKLQPQENSKNGDEDSKNDSEEPEKKVLEDSEAPTDVAKVSYYFETTTETAGDLNPELPTEVNSEMESLALVSVSEMETLVLSLQSMIDLESTMEPRAAEFENGSQREMETVGDNTPTQVLEDAAPVESVEEKSKLDAKEKTPYSKSEDAGPSLTTDRVMILEIQPIDLSRNEPTEQNTVVTRKGKSGARGEMKKGKSSDSTIGQRVGPTDGQEIDEQNMEIEANAKISDAAAGDENRANWNDQSESPKKIIQADQAAASNSEGADETLPELTVSDVVGKRKKAPRAKNAKKRKTAEGASIRV